jgi:hypothetical protein
VKNVSELILPVLFQVTETCKQSYDESASFGEHSSVYSSSAFPNSEMT